MANFDLIQISDDEYHVITRDGTITMRITAADVPRIRQLLDDPMGIFLEQERRLNDH